MKRFGALLLLACMCLGLSGACDATGEGYGMGSFKRPIVQNLQRVDAVDLNRVGQYSSRALQEVVRGLANGQNGVATLTALAVSAAGAGNFDVVAAPGLAFYYNATGLGADESAYRVIETYANTAISMGGAPPAAGTYYVHVRWASANGQSELREKRATAGTPFAPAACDTAHLSAPVFLVDPMAAVAGHLVLAKVVVPGGAVDSTAYTITDLRRMLWPPEFVYEPLVPTNLNNLRPDASGIVFGVEDGSVAYIVPASSNRRLVDVTVWGKVMGGAAPAASCQATLYRVTYTTGDIDVEDSQEMPSGVGYCGTTLSAGFAMPTPQTGHYVVKLAFFAGGGSLTALGVVARYERRLRNF